MPFELPPAEAFLIEIDEEMVYISPVHLEAICLFLTLQSEQHRP